MFWMLFLLARFEVFKVRVFHVYKQFECHLKVLKVTWNRILFMSFLWIYFLYIFVLFSRWDFNWTWGFCNFQEQLLCHYFMCSSKNYIVGFKARCLRIIKKKVFKFFWIGFLKVVNLFVYFLWKNFKFLFALKMLRNSNIWDRL